MPEPEQELESEKTGERGIRVLRPLGEKELSKDVDNLSKNEQDQHTSNNKVATIPRRYKPHQEHT